MKLNPNSPFSKIANVEYFQSISNKQDPQNITIFQDKPYPGLQIE